MRAIVLEEVELTSAGEKLEVLGQSALHLIKVVRIKIAEKVLVLNGRGLKILTEVSNLDKKKLELTVVECQKIERESTLDLFLAPPKKEAFEDILRNSCELGIAKIHLVESAYSQFKNPNSERCQRILIGAMEQSNNCYKPLFDSGLTTFANSLTLLEAYQQVFYFSPNGENSLQLEDKAGKYALFIGPEAGLTENEETSLKDLKNSVTIRLPSPILRAPTAASAATGFLMGHGLKIF